MSASSDLAVAEGRGSVTDVPDLPDGFTHRFTSHLGPCLDEAKEAAAHG